MNAQLRAALRVSLVAKPPAEACADWLASAHDRPITVWDAWYEGPAILPLGRLFDAIRITADTVHAAADATTHGGVTDLLSRLHGPVISDPWRNRYYALVPPQTTETWRTGYAQCLGRGAWLGVPVPALDTQHGPHWRVQMPWPGALCQPRDVADLVQVGHLRLTAAAQ
ncbi:hypothetical protein ACFVIM_34150 [Streptomyces sp. NPDC057638]|uniref:hypothetical protein n=1 Tax=Streptomyces sp. NPDC057638 TaxID=3346190 RepID=UPI0036BFB012